MGRFYLHNGDLQPSDEYLQTHTLSGYNPEYDWFHDDYDVEDDPTVLYEYRTCEKCGCSFTLSEAFSDYYDRIDWPNYGEKSAGEFCGNCTADMVDEEFKSE